MAELLATSHFTRQQLLYCRNQWYGLHLTNRYQCAKLEL